MIPILLVLFYFDIKDFVLTENEGREIEVGTGEERKKKKKPSRSDGRGK